MKKAFLKITLKSLEKDSLVLYEQFLLKTFKENDVFYTHVALPTKTKKFTLLKSPHVHKKARRQFAIKIHTRTFEINSDCSVYTLRLLITNKPKTLKIRITRLKNYK